MEIKNSTKKKIWLRLIWHNATATEDNMFRRDSRGDLKCRFCDENIHHLFFLCPAAKYMWSVVSLAIAAFDKPGNFTQYFDWIPRDARNLVNIHVVGLAALL
jgi:hypothetical protein